MQLFLVEDTQARRWSPFAETRPVGELIFGAFTLRERIERWVGREASGYLVAPGASLSGFDEPGSPPVLDDAPGDPRALFWLSRAAPEANAAPLPMSATPATAFVTGGVVVGLWLPDGPRDGLPEPAALLGGPADGLELPLMDAEVLVLEWPWSLVEANAQVLGRDLEWLHGHDDADALPGVHRVGSAALSLGQDARLGPGVVVDTRDGPVRLDDGAVVEGPARLTGPLHLGSGTQVFGGHLSRLSTGPVCKLRGEIDTAVLTGYCNKAHDGYLGHALLGRWVNLGALTTNSDLKNDYGPVRVQIGDEVVDTGLMKVGVFLGDHVKTGIGTVLNTGSVVGAGTNVFGGGMPPKYLPPFAWAGGGEVVPFRWEKFLKVARVVADRRSQPWTPGVEAVLRRLWDATHGDGPGESA